jgi:hypothetical protein
MGEIIKLKAEVEDDDASDFFDDTYWSVIVLGRHGGYTVALNRDSPHFWRWDISPEGVCKPVAFAKHSFPTRQEARADAWKALKRLIADAKKGGSR